MKTILEEVHNLKMKQHLNDKAKRFRQHQNALIELTSLAQRHGTTWLKDNHRTLINSMYKAITQELVLLEAQIEIIKATSSRIRG